MGSSCESAPDPIPSSRQQLGSSAIFLSSCMCGFNLWASWEWLPPLILHSGKSQHHSRDFARELKRPIPSFFFLKSICPLGPAGELGHHNPVKGRLPGHSCLYRLLFQILQWAMVTLQGGVSPSRKISRAFNPLLYWKLQHLEGPKAKA